MSYFFLLLYPVKQILKKEKHGRRPTRSAPSRVFDYLSFSSRARLAAAEPRGAFDLPSPTGLTISNSLSP